MENRQTAETILEWDGDQEDGEGISEKWAGLWWGQSHQCGSIWHLVSLPRSLGQPGSLLWDGLNKTFKVLMPSTSTWKKAEQITAGETQAAQHRSCDATVFWISPWSHGNYTSVLGNGESSLRVCGGASPAETREGWYYRWNFHSSFGGGWEWGRWWRRYSESYNQEEVGLQAVPAEDPDGPPPVPVAGGGGRPTSSSLPTSSMDSLTLKNFVDGDF